MSGPIILQREHFSIHQANEYFTPDGLCKETGQPVSQFRHVALKELLDNSLDAAETAGVAPVIAVEYAKTEGGLVLAVADNGAGIPAEVVGRILDFSTKTSDKAAYRAPTRGMQGNAIKTLFGMPVALGAERSHIRIDAAGIRHDIAVFLTPAGVRHDHQQTQTTTTGTRVSLIVPGIAVRYHWTPRHWIEAFGLFNPHARLQIREIEDFEHGPNDFERGKPACCFHVLEAARDSANFSDLSLPTVAFPGGWRKFLPSDPTPAHWYNQQEFARLAHLSAAAHPDRPLGHFIAEFKNLSRNARALAKACPAKTLCEWVADSARIADLHAAMKSAADPPRPEILGRVGPEHFRQRFDANYRVKDKRYWYKHQWDVAEGMPYLVEVAIAETEEPGGIFYGLNYSVPFADPLADTFLFHKEGDQESIGKNGLSGFLQECGVFSGERYGKARNTVAAVHLIMPILPTLDRGKSRLAISETLARAIAAVAYDAAKVLHKELVAWRKTEAKREREHKAAVWKRIEANDKALERREREEAERREKAERALEREARREVNEALAAQRRARGEKPTIEAALFELFLPGYLDVSEQESVHISARDFFYAIRPAFSKIEVRNGATGLDYAYFSSCLKRYRAARHPLRMIDFKARGTLHETRTGRQIPIGDRELRGYRLPVAEYDGVLIIEKEGVYETLRDTGGAELLADWRLMVAANAGYAVDALRKLLVPAQREAGWTVMVWHDADPDGYNIARTVGEPPAHLADHRLDVMDVGLRIEEGLALGLQTETFTRKKALPAGILPTLSETERRLFEGIEYVSFEGGKDRREWRECQRIEINALPIRRRPDYLEGKFRELFGRKEAEEGRPGQPGMPARPDAALLATTIKAVLARTLNAEAMEVAERLAEAALKTLPPFVIDAAAVQARMDADPSAPWRELVRQYVFAQRSDRALAHRRTMIEAFVTAGHAALLENAP